ncbi:MAG: translocation/assembly module TamB domain-containing protein, partial [Saprospiraceae bacterium]|nr:translocation/assembly module TamB domain-containing protein [Saprospiraceae bacterium]
KPKPFDLSINSIRCKECLVILQNKYNFSEQAFHFPGLTLQAKSVDIAENRFHFSSIRADEPFIRIRKFGTGPDVVETETSVTGMPDSLPPAPLFIFDHVLLNGGHFKMDDERRASQYGPGMDYRHIDVTDIDIDANDLHIQDLNFSGRLNQLAGQSDDFVIQKLSCPEVRVTSTETELLGFKLQTSRSSIQDTLRLHYQEYPDWQNFVDRIRIDFQLNQSSLGLQDLVYFAPPLSDVSFFKDNIEEKVQLSGWFEGPVSRINATNLDIQIPGLFALNGDVSTRNIQDKERTLLNVKLNQLLTRMATIRKLFPGMQLPPDFDKLANLEFTGRFDGYYQDFVAYGALSTALGRAEMDMRLNATKGRDAAEYSGQLELLAFDLGKWVGTSDLGKVSLSAEVKNGHGLRKENLDALIDANVSSLEYRNYQYRNAIMKGRLQRNRFDGDFSIADANIDLSFNGLIDFSDSIPDLAFNARVERLATKPLNLTQKDLDISGNIHFNVRGIDPNRFIGEIVAENLLIEKGLEENYALKQLKIQARNQDQLRFLTVDSDLGSGSMQGDFLLTKTIPFLKKSFNDYYPDYGAKFGWDSVQVTEIPTYFTLDFQLNDPKSWFNLINLPIHQMHNASLTAHFDNRSGTFASKVQIPELSWADAHFQNVAFAWDGGPDSTDFKLQLDSSHLAPTIPLDYLHVDGHIRNNQTHFQIQTADLVRFLDGINIEGDFEPSPEGYNIWLDPQDLMLFGTPWQLDAGNHIFLGNRRINLENFVLQSGEQSIELRSEGSQGLVVDVQQFPVGWIDSVWVYDKLNFAGNANLYFSLKNVFDWKDLNIKGEMDQLKINGDPYGQVFLSVSRANTEDAYAAFLKIEDVDKRFSISGFLHPKSEDNPEMTVDLKGAMTKYPLKIGEYFLAGSISETTGTLDGDITLTGPLSKMVMLGSAKIRQGETKIDYLGTKYYMYDQTVNIRENLFDFTGMQLSDALGNRATATGGIEHDHLHNFRLNARIISPKIMALNTTKKDNSAYYGKAIGRLDCTFRGPFNAVDIYVNATTSAGTTLSIPISYATTTSTDDFITFVSFDSTKNTPPSRVVTNEGLDFRMDLAVTEEAEINIIFDEAKGDVIRGKGTANLQIEMSRTGQFEMRGLYEISEGNYLFTFGVINKPFIVYRGGTIRWSGDPYAAEINLDAEYRGLQANMANFLAEYANQISSNASYNINTPVQLILHLTGDLLQPNISFDLAFPELTGELKSYADAKLNILKSDPNALNNQVLSLFLFGNFIPSNNITLSNQFFSNSGANTLSQWVSNQLSIFLTDLISEAVSEYGFISGVDFDINWNLYSQLNTSAERAITQGGSEVQLHFRNRLFNDRLALNFGANFVNDSPINGTYIAGDFSLEYYITQDRRLALRLYQRPEETIEGRRNKFGMGLTYRKEFDNLFDFRKHLSEDIGKAVGGEKSDF